MSIRLTVRSGLVLSLLAVTTFAFAKTDSDKIPCPAISTIQQTASKIDATELNGDGTYSPYPGLCATLVQNQGAPVTYTLKDGGQKTYTFDAIGKFLSYAETSKFNSLFPRVSRWTDAHCQ